MSNALIGFGNKIESAAVSGGSWLLSLPITNVQDKILGHVARSNDLSLSSTVIEIAFYQPVKAAVIGMFNHNGSLDAYFRIRGSDTSTYSNLLIDSDWKQAWPAVYTTYELDWEASNWWSGQYTIDEIASSPPSYIYIPPKPTWIQFLRIEISDTGNEEGFFELGRIFCGDAWQPAGLNITNVSLGFKDDSPSQRAVGGSLYFDKRPKRRVAKFAVDNLENDEAMSKGFEVLRQSGTTEEVVFIMNPEDTRHALRRQFLGTFTDLSPIDFQFYRRIPLSIEEVR